MERIATIPRPLSDKFVNSDPTFLALDLLWADPATRKEEIEKLGNSDTPVKTAAKTLNFESLFGENNRGGNALIFGTKAMDEFVSQTGCHHLIRAHQPPNSGFDYSKSARIITVFSSSHYCGGYNSAALVLACDDGKIRVATIVSAARDESTQEDPNLGSDDENIQAATL